MEFDINKFANEFKNTIKWMLNDGHAQELRNDLLSFQENKNILENEEPYPIKALSMIVELIITNSWHFRPPENFRNQMESFTFSSECDKNDQKQKAAELIAKLIEIVGEKKKGIIEKKKKNIERLFKYSTLKDFTDNLYNLAKKGKTEVLGPKGRDNYLRDFGYWDRIPIDIHEKRFIIRSGIYHSCSSKQQSDPLDKDDLQDTLTIFCTEHLKECVVKKEDIGIDTDIKLSSAPGIVDIFIWSFSAEDRYNICGATPRCDECKLNGVCLYALTNSP